MKPDTGKGKKLKINLEPEMDKPHSGFKVTLQKPAKIKTFSINQAIKSLYLSCYNEFAQNALSDLAQQLVNYPAGLSVSY